MMCRWSSKEPILHSCPNNIEYIFKPSAPSSYKRGENKASVIFGLPAGYDVTASVHIDWTRIGPRQVLYGIRWGPTVNERGASHQNISCKRILVHAENNKYPSHRIDACWGFLLLKHLTVRLTSGVGEVSRYSFSLPNVLLKSGSKGGFCW